MPTPESGEAGTGRAAAAIARARAFIALGKGRAKDAERAFKAAAENYAEAARQGNGRALNKLVAMTRAPKCEARSEAADALGTLHNKKARAALKKLSVSRFKDESRTPGIFSCSSRRAAEKALDKQRG